MKQRSVGRLAFAAGVISVAPPARAAMSGHVAFLRNGAVYVTAAAKGKPVRALDARGVYASLSPTQGILLVGTDRKTVGGTVHGAAAAHSPYRDFVPVNGLSADGLYAAVWSGDGRLAFVQGTTKCGAYTAATNRFAAASAKVETANRSGNVTAYSTERNIRVRLSGRERAVFSIGQPAALFAALRAARTPRNLRDMTSEIDPSLWKDARNWAFGGLALAPDGKTLFFACNAGTSSGAAGNTTWCWFAANTSTGRLAVLSKDGARFSRIPTNTAVSPDGKRLLFVTSVHSSAVENPCAVNVLDLLTQSSRNMLTTDPQNAKDVNLVSGACWSPDSRAVALSVFYYSEAAMWKHPDTEPTDNDFTLEIKDAATARTLQKIPAAVQPSWTAG